MTLPKGWVEITLEEVGRWGSGGTPKASDTSFYGGDIPWVRSGDLPDGAITAHEATISEAGLANSSAKWVADGAVLVAMYGATIGKLGITTYPVTTNQAIAFIEPCDGIEARYLFENLRHRKPELVALGQGGAQPNISQEILKAQPFSLPPLAEQRRIVAKLDTLTARLARARADLDRVPVLAQRLRAATLAEAFGSDEGSVVELGTLTSPSAPVRYGVLQPGDEKGLGVQMIRVCDLQGMRIAWPEVRRIAPHIDSQFANARVQNGDVLLSVVGTIGRIAIVTGMTEPTNIARAVARLRPDPAKVLSMWLALRLAAPDCQKTFAGDAREVARKTLNVSLIKAVPIMLPSLAAQAETVSRIEVAFARADRMEAEAARARALLDRLEAAVLAKAFRGELVPQDPTDEPASKLLARIRAQRADAPKVKRGRRAKADAQC